MIVFAGPKRVPDLASREFSESILLWWWVVVGRDHMVSLGIGVSGGRVVLGL